MGAVDFSDLITFTRASGGGRFNAQGQYEWLPANTPRINYDPVTGECLGLLIEEQRTNLIRQNSRFSSSNWTKGAGILLSTDGTLAPDGAAAEKAEVLGATRQIIQPLSITPVVGATYTASIWLKPGPKPFGFQIAYYDGGLSMNSTIVMPEPGRWARYSFTFTPTSLAASPQLRLLGFNSGELGDSIYMWGAQLEAGSFPTSCIPAEAAQVTRAASDPLLQTLSPWLNQSAGTFIIEHDAVAGRPLLSSGETLLASSGGAGRTVLAYDATGSYVSQNGGAFVAGPPLTFADSLRLMRSATQLANAHCRALRYYPRRLTLAEASA